MRGVREAGSGNTRVGALRPMLAGIFLFGSVGTAVELVLLEHTEDAWQLSPLVLIAGGCAALGVLAARPGAASLRAFQVAMVMLVASGLAGIGLHYKGNIEFELEMYPGMAGWELFWASMKGATPSLAPGVMIQLGLVGLAYTYRHPAGSVGIGGG